MHPNRYRHAQAGRSSEGRAVRRELHRVLERVRPILTDGEPGTPEHVQAVRDLLAAAQAAAVRPPAAE